jgi:hypothetical protein
MAIFQRQWKYLLANIHEHFPTGSQKYRNDSTHLLEYSNIFGHGFGTDQSTLNLPCYVGIDCRSSHWM